MNKKDMLVKIHGYVAADGGIYSYKNKDRHGGKLRIRKYKKTRFYNKEAALIKDFLKTIKLLYPKIKSIKYYPKRYEIEVRNYRISKDILQLGKIGSKVWEVPKDLSRRQKIIWLRAFVDGEGTVSNSNHDRYVVINSINREGLKEVSNSLKELGIENKFYRIDFRDYIYYRIKISRKENLVRFYKLIGFNHLKRQNKLAEVIKSYR